MVVHVRAVAVVAEDVFRIVAVLISNRALHGNASPLSIGASFAVQNCARRILALDR
jgi:hypothetical protein